MCKGRGWDKAGPFFVSAKGAASEGRRSLPPVYSGLVRHEDLVNFAAIHRRYFFFPHEVRNSASRQWTVNQKTAFLLGAEYAWDSKACVLSAV